MQRSRQLSGISCKLLVSVIHISVGGGPVVARHTYSRMHVYGPKGTAPDPEEFDRAIVVLRMIDEDGRNRRQIFEIRHCCG